MSGLEMAPALRVAFALAGLAVAMLWELRRPFRGAAPRRLRHELVNLGLWLGNSVALQALLGAAAVGTALWAEQRQIGLLHALAPPPAVRVALTILALDLATCLLHRAYHRVPGLWRLHRVHHSDRDLRATTGVRFHPFEVGLSTLVRMGVVVALAASALGVLVFEAGLLLASQLQHADVRLPPRVDACLRWLLVTPNLHRVHHSRVRVEADSNFGTILTLWDRILRSYREHDPLDDLEAGAPDGDAADPDSLLGLWLMPLRWRGGEAPRRARPRGASKLRGSSPAKPGANRIR